MIEWIRKAFSFLKHDLWDAIFASGAFGAFVNDVRNVSSNDNAVLSHISRLLSDKTAERLNDYLWRRMGHEKSRERQAKIQFSFIRSGFFVSCTQN